MPKLELLKMGLDKNQRNKLLTKLKKDREDCEAEIDARLPAGTIITGGTQIEFTDGIFEVIGADLEQATQKSYEKDHSKWSNSSSSRTRLVCIEASEGIAMEDLAQLIFKAASTVRIIVTELQPTQRNELQAKLTKLWKEKLSNNNEYQQTYVKFYKNNSNQNKHQKDWKSILKARSLDDLLGPHAAISDSDIRWNTMTERFPNFDIPIEEILCFGEKHELVENLNDLSSKIDSGVQISSIRSKPYAAEEKDFGLWKCASRDSQAMLPLLVNGKSSKELIGKNTNDGYERVRLDPVYARMLKLEGYKEFMSQNAASGDFKYAADVEQKDLDYLRDILFSKSLYPPGTGPKALPKTISKASSNISEIKGKVVAKSLLKNVYGNPESSFVESEFSIGDITSDGGNDMIKEALDKRDVYKRLFEGCISYYLSQGKNSEEAKKHAFAQTVEAYSYAEKKNATIKDLEWGETGAEIWRDYGLHESNKLQRANTKANRPLKLLMPLFILGAVLTIGGIITAIFPFTAIAVPKLATVLLGITGFTGFTTATLLKAKSIFHQKKANRDILSRANNALAIANSKKYDAQRERIAILKERLHNIQQGIPNTETAQDQIPTATYNGNFLANKEKYRLRAILEKIDTDINFKKIKGTIRKEGLLSVINNLYAAEGKRSNAIKKEEYSRNFSAWKDSATSRSTLNIVEADAKNLKTLAYITLEASPSDRVLVTGLHGELKEKFRKEVINLWKIKLQCTTEQVLNKKQKLAADHYKKQFFKNFCDKETHEKITAKNKNEQAIKARWEKYFADKKIDHLVKAQLSTASLEQLLGPHLHQPDWDISHKTLSERFKGYHPNIEQLLCYGQTKELAEKLGGLGQEIRNGGVPIFSIKSTPILDSERGLWNAEAKNKKFLKQLTQGMPTEELLGIQKDGSCKYINFCPSFKDLFDVDTVQRLLIQRGLDPTMAQQMVRQKDIDFFEKICIKEAQYPAGTSPEELTKTMAKASSKLMAIAGKDVAKSLAPSVVDIPLSTAEEIRYAILSTVKDGGTDIIKEELDKKNTYKQFIENLKATLIDSYNWPPYQATQEAFTQMVHLYYQNERKNGAIRKLVAGDAKHCGAKEWRTLGLEYTNKAKESTQRGKKWLYPVGVTNAASVALQLVGFGLLFAGSAIVPPVWLGLAITGVVLLGVSMVSLFRSTQHIKRANGKELAIANSGFKYANENMFQAHQIREKETAEYVTKIKEKWKHDNPKPVRTPIVKRVIRLNEERIPYHKLEQRLCESPGRKRPPNHSNSKRPNRSNPKKKTRDYHLKKVK